MLKGLKLEMMRIIKELFSFSSQWHLFEPSAIDFQNYYINIINLHAATANANNQFYCCASRFRIINICNKYERKCLIVII